MSRMKQSIVAAKKKREKQPRPVPKVLDPIGTGKMRQHSQNNIEVLFAIESALVVCFLEDDRVDDAVVLASMRSVVLEDPPASMPHAWIYSELIQASLQCGAEAEVFSECLRMIMDSVRRHSLLRPGETAYLEFAAASVGIEIP